MVESLELRLQPDDGRLTWAHFLEDVAARHGDRVALRFAGRDTTYRELRGQARAAARGLIGAGVVKGARVGVLVTNRPEWVVGAFGAALAGAVHVPISTMATPDERDYILRHADVSVLLAQPRLGDKRDYVAELIERYPELASGEPGRLRCAALPFLRRVVATEGDGGGASGVESWDALLAMGRDVPEALLDAACAEIAPADDGIVIYTSGTTANPKGVVHTQRAGVIQSWRFADLMCLEPEDRVWTAQPFFWTAGIAMSLGASLAAGSALVLEETFEPAASLALIERERVTAVFAFPHQEQMLGEDPSAASRDLSSVTKTRFTSPLAALAGVDKNEWGVDASFGLSETFTLASMLRADTPAEVRTRCSGRALPGTEVTIVDPDSGEPVPQGEAGEIAVRGATFMRGYNKVVPEEYLEPNGTFRTQDGGWIDDEGLLHWTGRLSGLIKTGGANVSPIEIERAIASYAGLKVVAALGVPHPTLGEALVLCVVPTDGARPPDEAAIRAFLRERVSAFKVPRRVLVFDEADISYTANAKVQVPALRDRAMARLSDEGAEIAGHRYA